jgi:hypothetical protein
MTTPNSKDKKLVERIYKRHLRLFRELNDIHIFVSKAIPLLNAAAANTPASDVTRGKDMSFKVPGKSGRAGIAKRNPKELKTLLKRFAQGELYENLLVSSVSRFEFYLADIIGAYLKYAPKKLTIGPKGGDSGKQVPVQLVVDSESLEELIDGVIEQRVQAIFYAEPEAYCTYFNAVSELGISVEAFRPFFEIKATRDLIVHNSLRVNDLYVKKAGDLKRGDIGDELEVGKEYFEKSISHMKTLSGLIEKATRAKYEQS